MTPSTQVADHDEPCLLCDDSGYIETVTGGLWTGENLRSTFTICDCPCGDDVRRVQEQRKSRLHLKGSGHE